MKLSAKTLGESLKGVGTTLVMKVGGASGPLYGTLFMSLGKTLEDEVTREQFADAFADAVDAVKARGKSDVGQKTMLDVLFPVLAVLREGGAGLPQRLKAAARVAAEQTVPMRAIRGRASFLGERSIGHMDPGARSSVIDRRRGRRGHGRTGDERERRNRNCVALGGRGAGYRRSWSSRWSGDEVPLGWCGGDPGGGLGTNVEAIMAAIDRAWSEKGVAILVDLGGAETNSEMAIEMLPESRAHPRRGLQCAGCRGRGHGGDRSGVWRVA